MAETTSTMTYWDHFLRIWAILGPLATALVSAVWARYTKTRDRAQDKLDQRERASQELEREKARIEIEHAHELERLEQNQKIKLLENKGEKRGQKYDEAKIALVNFMASSQEYTVKQVELLNSTDAEIKQAASAANDKYNYSYQMVDLICDDSVKDAALTLWNLSHDLPTKATEDIRNKTELSTTEYETTLKKYMAAKSKFSAVARAYLRSLDPDVD